MAQKKIDKNRMKTFIKKGRRSQKKGGKKEDDLKNKIKRKTTSKQTKNGRRPQFFFKWKTT